MRTRRRYGVSKAVWAEASGCDLPPLLAVACRYINEINDQIRPVLDRIKQQALPTSRGVTFLQVKLHLLLCYVTNLAFYLLLKAEGRSVKDHPVLDQILRTRYVLRVMLVPCARLPRATLCDTRCVRVVRSTMLDRLKPLDSKLQYQIARLLRSGECVPLRTACRRCLCVCRTATHVCVPRVSHTHHALAAQGRRGPEPPQPRRAAATRHR